VGASSRQFQQQATGMSHARRVHNFRPPPLVRVFVAEVCSNCNAAGAETGLVWLVGFLMVPSNPFTPGVPSAFKPEGFLPLFKLPASCSITKVHPKSLTTIV